LALAFCLILASPRAFADENPLEIRYRVPPTPQHWCGVDSLYVCLRAGGRTDVSLRAIEDDLRPGPDGVSLEALRATCERLGSRAEAVRFDPPKLSEAGIPMLLHVNDSHYVAVLGKRDDRYTFFDNRVGLFDCPEDYFQEHYRWDGVALLIGPRSPAIAFRLYGPWVLLASGAAVGLAVCVGYRRGWWRRRGDVQR
jgi:hypothetical protein